MFHRKIKSGFCARAITFQMQSTHLPAIHPTHLIHPCSIFHSTYSMQQSPSEKTSSSTSQEIPHILRNLKVHYSIHECSPPAPILSHIDPVHAHTSHCLKIHLNIILSSMPGSSKWFFPSGFHTKTLQTPLLSPICATCPTHLILLELITQIISGEEYRSLTHCGRVTQIFVFNTVKLGTSASSP